MQRREWIQALAALPFAMGAGGLLAAPATPARFLFVFLRGGCDAAHVLVPVESDFYYRSRPNIAIPRPSADTSSAVRVDAQWGMHPALRAALGPFLARGELAFVPFSGTDDLSRSHFETQDSIELGLPTGGPRSFRSGFLGRLAAELQGASPIAFTDQLPLAFRSEGGRAVPNLSPKSVGKGGIDARQQALIQGMYQGSALSVPVQEGFTVREDVARAMAGEMEAASRNALSARGFELEARRIGGLMRDRYSLGFVDVGGWDTHVGQGASTGALASRLDELGRGLSAFAAGIGPAWERTTVVVMSEFGRTFRENGNRGTDHGHGGVMWVLGGTPRPAPVLGRQVAIDRDTLFHDRDWPVLNDYRAVLAALFRSQFGLGDAQLQRIFPGVAPAGFALA